MRRGFLLAALAVIALSAPSAAYAAEALIGSANSVSVAHETEAGHQECARFVALETGRLTELFLQLNSTANTGVTKTVLGVESEGSSAPSGTVLAEGELQGVPSGSLTLTGLGLRLTYQDPYWLCWLPVGGALHMNVSVASGGSSTAKSSSGSFTKLGSATWTPGSVGPLVYEGTGVAFPTIEFAEPSAAKVEAITAELKLLKSEVAIGDASDAKIVSLLEGTLTVSCSSGCSGSGGGGSSVTSSQLDGDIEALEVVGWCILGVLLGAVVLFLWTNEIRSK